MINHDPAAAVVFRCLSGNDSGKLDFSERIERERGLQKSRHIKGEEHM